MEKFPPVTGIVSLENIKMGSGLLMNSKDDLSPSGHVGMLIRSLAIHLEQTVGRQNALAAELEKIKAHLRIQ